MPRKQSTPITTPGQLRILSSPATLEVLEAIQVQGPSSITALGPALGRKPNTLHYHIRKLVKAGMIKQVGSNRSGARTEAIYDVTAGVFDGSGLLGNPRHRKAAVDAVASILRLATRNFASALRSPSELRERGKHRNILAARAKVRLTRTQLAEVNGHLQALERIFQTNSGSRCGELHALTLVMTPLEDNSES